MSEKPANKGGKEEVSLDMPKWPIIDKEIKQEVVRVLEEEPLLFI